MTEPENAEDTNDDVNFGGMCEDAPCCGCCGNGCYVDSFLDMYWETRFDWWSVAIMNLVIISV